MRTRFRQYYRPGISSLGEMIVALVIGAMVLTAILTVYGRVNQAAEAILGRVEGPALATEVLQRLAEDLDRVQSGQQDVTIQIKNGLDHNFARAQLVIRRTMRNSKNEEKVFEEITWRAGYDYEGSSGLVIYRGHEGIDREDKLLDAKRETWEDSYPLVPLCRGVTYFRLEVPKGDELVDQWTEGALPPGVKATISFAQPHETVQGTWEVYEEEKTSRTIAVDKTRKIKFVMAAAGTDVNDPNAAAGEQTPEETDEKTPQKPGQPGLQKTSERGSRATDGRTPQRSNEPVPYKPVQPVPGKSGRTGR
ncbi:MAG: hypothetical protein EHM35_04145 [Planctomycetaceae bacterium]|nr:MAG: hypothetical protein EHM35_04145 [Planctomycetaceae bacterium]